MMLPPERPMLYSVVRLTAVMHTAFREPLFQLATQASDILETFYRALQPSQQLKLSDLLTFGGNSYGDLRLRINTFRGGGGINVTPSALIVELNDLQGETG